MAEEPFPHGLDLRLQQKFFIVRKIIEKYKLGQQDLADGLRQRAEEIGTLADKTSVAQVGYAAGYAKAAVQAQEAIDSVNWEDIIIDAQATLLERHQQDGGEEGE